MSLTAEKTEATVVGRVARVTGPVVDLEWVATAETARVTACAYGDDARTRAIAFWMREAAMSSIAFVIFLVVCAEAIFCL